MDDRVPFGMGRVERVKEMLPEILFDPALDFLRVVGVAGELHRVGSNLRRYLA